MYCGKHWRSASKETQLNFIHNQGLTFVHVYSFLTSSKHIHTPWGHALQVALTTTASRDADNKNKPSFHTQEALLTAMELIRFEVLTNKPYTKSYSRIAGDGKLFLSCCIECGTTCPHL